MTEEYRSAKEVARMLGTDARTIRKFLRSEASPFEAVGQGGRYNFDDEDVEELRRAFNKELTKKKTPAKPKIIEVKETNPDQLSDYDLDFDDDLEEIEEDDL